MKSSNLKFASTPPAACNCGPMLTQELRRLATAARAPARAKHPSQPAASRAAAKSASARPNRRHHRTRSLFPSTSGQFLHSLQRGAQREVERRVCDRDRAGFAERRCSGCSARAGSSAAKSFVSSCTQCGRLAVRQRFDLINDRVVLRRKGEGRPLGSAFSGQRPPPHFASNTSITLPRAMA